jgi:hypothetical protein
MIIEVELRDFFEQLPVLPKVIVHMTTNAFHPILRPDNPGFQDLPWDQPFDMWENICSRVEQVPRGLSRHPLVFVNYVGELYAIKQLPAGIAQREYQALLLMEQLRLPAVTAVGYAQLSLADNSQASFLFSRYLESALPYRSLFMRSNLDRYRDHLLDAIAGLLVQLHLAGVFWGDCSLSNTLYRRDAGLLQAYLVDAETSEIHPSRLSPALRHLDLEIMEDNLVGDLTDLANLGFVSDSYPIHETGEYIRQRYRRLWEEITRDLILGHDEHFRVQEHVRALNELGFSVKEVELIPETSGDRVRLRVSVTDRNYHRDQLLALTGLEAQEVQARQLINEILEVKAYLSQQNERSTPLSVAAYHWLQNIYQPVIDQLAPSIQRATGITEKETNSVELYCQILEHKWFLSEKAQRDVGHQAATEDYLQNFNISAKSSQ